MTTARTVAAALAGVAVGAVAAVTLWGGGSAPADAAPGSTPAACLEALDYASDGFTASADALDAARDALAAAGSGDSPAVRRSRDAMEQAADRLEGLAPGAAAASRACRAGR